MPAYVFRRIWYKNSYQIWWAEMIMCSYFPFSYFTLYCLQSYPVAKLMNLIFTCSVAVIFHSLHRFFSVCLLMSPCGTVWCGENVQLLNKFILRWCQNGTLSQPSGIVLAVTLRHWSTQRKKEKEFRFRSRWREEN